VGVSVRVTGEPKVSLDDRARIEVALPISGADCAWLSAFEDALPTRRHTWRVIANEDVIKIVVDDEGQLADFMYVVSAAVEHANDTIKELEAKVSRITTELANGGLQPGAA
jgi:hypothetical protein